MSKINRVTLLNKGLFVEHVSEKSVKILCLPYNNIHSVEYRHDDDSVCVDYKVVFNDVITSYTISKESLISINSHFWEKSPKDRMRSFYNELTMTYLTNHYD